MAAAAEEVGVDLGGFGEGEGAGGGDEGEREGEGVGVEDGAEIR